MGFEFRVVFLEAGWYQQNREVIFLVCYQLDSFVKSQLIRGSPLHKSKEIEIWMLDDKKSQFLYDQRIFLRENTLEIEVLVFTASFYRDLALLLNFISQKTSAFLINDDGEIVSLPVLVQN